MAGRVFRVQSLLAAVLALLPFTARADIAGEPSRVHALTGVTIVAEPGAEPVAGTVVLRDARIERLGAGVEIPAGAIVHDRTGRTVYAGLIEPYLRLTSDADAGPRGTAHDNPRVRSDVRVADLLPLPVELRLQMRKAGYTTAMVAPGSGVFRGTAAVVSLADGDPADHIVVPDAAQIVAFEHGSWRDRRYPNSLMGVIALQRQTLLDAAWHRDAWAAWREHGDETERPEENASLRALEPGLDREMPVFWESEDLRMLPRALAIAREMRVRPVIVSGRGDEYRRPEQVRDWLEAAGAGLVLTVAFPRAPHWKGPDEEAAIGLAQLVHWERAPTNPGALSRAGVPFSVTTQGLEEPERVLARLRTAIRLGLPEAVALAAITVEPARLLGLEERTGTLAPGKAANLVVTTGPLFDAGTKVEEVWIDGVRFGEDPRLLDEEFLKGSWDLSWAAGDSASEVTFKFKPVVEGLDGEVVPPEAGSDAEPGAEKPPAEKLASPVLHRGTLSFGRDDLLFELRRDGRLLRGTARTGGGEPVPVIARKPAHDPKEPDNLWVLHSDGVPEWPPVAGPEDAPPAVLVRGATVWTSGPSGKIEGADVLAVDGKIEAVGKGLTAPADALVIEGAGKHVTAGLIDCHSHSDISGGVNECSNSATAECRIGDVVDPWSPAIYRELAGGLTVSNLLHGSCNVIGGQNAVIKLRWGAPAEELKLDGAKPGIKFALGENVKQSNWGLPDSARTRYPQTRMGVEQFLRERFDAALEYRAEWDRWRYGGRRGAPPRRDLQLDTLLEILDGDRIIHCHSYRADEIIMMIRVAEDYGFRMGTFQHVLEGYKCADEIAAHGAGASAFSDRWSYKYEVIDAIPYNGEIMWRRGVTVSFNSDSKDVARRMNLEGAKAVKYGGVPETEALDFVVRNPAVQLHIDDRVGSLEPGKDADFVVWSGHPLSDAAVCEETWIDGVRRFSRRKDLAARAGVAELRRALLEKAGALNRIHEVDPSVKDEGSMPAAAAASALGRRFGATDEETGADVGRGECLACEEES
ncbi:MAG TPA: amidohydrolase family protein [bacterium]|nr:amidohydrolase family protein [bacterium]